VSVLRGFRVDDVIWLEIVLWYRIAWKCTWRAVQQGW
jgi:hypothetical protein